MDEQLRDQSHEPDCRRLRTPVPKESHRVAERAGSQITGQMRAESRLVEQRSWSRSRSPARSQHNYELEANRERVRMLEDELLRERRRLLYAEDHQWRNSEHHEQGLSRQEVNHTASQLDYEHRRRTPRSQDTLRTSRPCSRRQGSRYSRYDVQSVLRQQSSRYDKQRASRSRSRQQRDSRSPRSTRRMTRSRSRRRGDTYTRPGTPRASRMHDLPWMGSRRNQEHERISNEGPPKRYEERPTGSSKDKEEHERSGSSLLTKNDFVDIFKCIKDTLTSQPPAKDMRSFQKVDHMNILPSFDPFAKNQRIDIWVKKINECASVYGWDDKTTTHFAMQKLQGLAKTWYEGLNSVLFTWPEWQDQLLKAFPHEQNYGQVLEEMLKRRSRYNESIETYYYEKLALLNQCEIDGKKAVDCIIHGISDRNLKSGARALQYSQPDQLLGYLINSKDSTPYIDKNQFRNGSQQRVNKSFNSPSVCFNCKEKGHGFLHCPKPLIKCTRCSRVGHTLDKCTRQNENKGSNNNVTKTMTIESKDQFVSNSKYIKEVRVNDVLFESFIDFGSDVSLLSESTARKLRLTHDNVPYLMKGFGNSTVQALGGVCVDINIDGVSASVSCRVVSDSYMEKSVLIGQSYTEQPHIVVVKDATRLQFIDVSNEMPCLDVTDDVLSIKAKAVANLELYGAASVRAQVDPVSDGYILLRECIAGKPNRQYLVCGGLYQSKNGFINIVVVPCSSSSWIANSSVLCRGDRVDIVNRVFSESSEILAAQDSNLDEDQVRVGKGVTEDQKQRLLSLLTKYKHCFASSLKELGCTNATEMNIELNSKRPIVYRPYRLSHHEREKVRTMVQEMLDAGIVRESVSEYASPILLVRKKDGSLRLCVDYRMLNAATVKERYPMPHIEDELARLSGQAWFISLDLASGYYQVPIAEQSRHLTSFVTPDGQYEFNRMPFGLANAPAVFQRMMNSILGSARFNKATAYIDDVLIYGRDASECLTRLEEVLLIIERANLTLNLSKCDFLQNKIDYLGYEISAEGVRPGERKILSVVHFPRPENVHNVRQFLGLASYFRKFIKDFAQISFPLSRLLKKNTDWEWSETQEKAFQTLKDLLVSRPVLALYDPSAETELHTDASRLGVGGILLQRLGESESFRPVAFYSRQTSPEEKNFHSYELETLAVVCSLRKFRVYLLGKQFKIVTDCSALRSTFSKRDLIPRIARWWLSLQEFDCEVEYRAGAKMSHVDALSRNPISSSDEICSDRDQLPAVLSISDEDWLHTLQLGDTELGRIKSILSSGLDEKGLKYIKENYIIKENKLFRCIGGDKDNIRWVVPKGARWQLCRMNHDDIGHFGVEKTLERIKKYYWFAKMAKFVKKYVNACIECAFAKNNSDSREGLLHPITKVDLPFHTLHGDHLGPFVKSKRGYTHLLVVVDAFTKFCYIKPVRNTTSQNAIKVFQDIFDTFRRPDRLITDRGSCFTSHAFKHFCNDQGVKHILNAVASPRSNGQVERYNRTILDSLKAMTIKHGERDWDNHIGKIQWGLNNTIQKTTGRTPSEVLFGTNMNSEVKPILNEVVKETREFCDTTIMREQVKDRIDNNQELQKQIYDKDRKPARTYSEGDLVKLRKTCFDNDGQSKKLLPIYIGPYRVTEVLGKDRYRLAPVPGMAGTQNRHPTTVAADRMMPWIHVAALQVNDNDSDNYETDGSDQN